MRAGELTLSCSVTLSTRNRDGTVLNTLLGICIHDSDTAHKHASRPRDVALCQDVQGPSRSTSLRTFTHAPLVNSLHASPWQRRGTCCGAGVVAAGPLRRRLPPVLSALPCVRGFEAWTKTPTRSQLS
jgi:hypothetical protein